MLNDFALVLIFAVLGILFIFGSLLAGSFLRPKNPNPVKSEIYECGEPSKGSGWINFNMRFYLIALIFVIFDVEAALMFPVAAVFKKWLLSGNGILALAEIGLFVLILAAGLLYVWVKKDLDWAKKVVSD
ncbi:MAG: NADH-quinone oxidoreductase subunit A [Deltaproteobacteria bacterium]|nr:NADH-quinone oxidoreductase subunit A [Deltaproteobacteria bacterium]MBI2975070.1 NADH-quinone oxidoreductase subunit A [Deltaproteobacteria bacterium]